jgi:chromosome segregation ATPase
MQMIRKISSFFSGASFPEFDAFHRNLLSLREKGGSLAAASSQAFSEPHNLFVQSQFDDVKSKLETIFIAGKSASESIGSFYASTETLGTALSPLSLLGTELSIKKKELQKANDDVTFAEAITAHFQELVTKTEAAGVAKATDKAREELNDATQQLSRDRARVHSLQEEIHQLEQCDKIKVFETVVDNLNTAIDAKLQELEALSQAATRISEAAANIGNYEDKLIPILRARLEELERPCVE